MNNSQPIATQPTTLPKGSLQKLSEDDLALICGGAKSKEIEEPTGEDS